MQEDTSAQRFQLGDLVLVINADYNPDLIGHVGTIARPARRLSGYDRHGRLQAGVYVVVDLPDKINRHGTTLWYKTPQYLVKITPDRGIERAVDADTLETSPACH